MGVMDLLLDSEYDEEMYYLRSLSNAKLIAANWFNHGRMMRPLELKLNTSHGDASAVGVVVVVASAVAVTATIVMAVDLQSISSLELQTDESPLTMVDCDSVEVSSHIHLSRHHCKEGVRLRDWLQRRFDQMYNILVESPHVQCFFPS